MPFFTNDTANTVQLISLPLELIGLSMATLEFKFPSLSYRILEYIRDTEDYPLADLNIKSGCLIFISAISTMAALAYFTGVMWLSMIGILVIIIPIIAMESLYLLGGRPFLTVGLSLAFLGCLGEIYQVLTLWYG